MAAAEFIVRLVDQLSGPAKVAEAAIKRLRDAAKAGGGDGMKRLSDDIRRVQTMANGARIQMEKMHQAGQRVGQGFRSIGSGALQAGLLGLTYQATKYGAALGFVKSQLLGTQVEFENFQATLETMSRSPEKAKVLMNWASDFAVKTPFELDQVVGALAKLSAYGVVDPKKVYEVQGKARIDRTMTAIGDASSSLNKPYMQGVEAVADAMTGQFERLKEAYGIMGSKKGDKVTLEWLDLVEDKTKNITLDLKNREKIIFEIVKILEKNYGSGMLKKSQTAGGMLSNYADAWTRFKQMIISSGLGDEVNRQLKSGLDYLEVLSKPYKVKGPDNMWETRSPLMDIAAQFSGVLQNRLRETIQLGQDLYQTIKRLVDILDQFANSRVGQAIGGWNTMIKSILAVPFVKPVFEMVKGVWDIAGGMIAAGVQGLIYWKILKAIKALAPTAAAVAGPAAAVAAPVATTAAVAATSAGSGAATTGTTKAAEVAAKSGRLGTLLTSLSPALRLANALSWAYFVSEALDNAFPSTKQGKAYRLDAGPIDFAMYQRSWRAQQERRRDPEAARGRAMMSRGLGVSLEPVGKRSDLSSIVQPFADLRQQIDEISKAAGEQARQNLNITATPKVDASSLDAAIAKAREFRAYMQSIGTVSPSAAPPPGATGAAPGGPGPQSGRGGPPSVTIGSVTVNAGGGNVPEAAGRKVAQAVREAMSRTFGDGYQKSTMVG